jgi:hypothetical protein
VKVRLPAALALLACLAAPAVASASEPWSDDDPAAPPTRYPITETLGVRGAAEYRANWLLVNPISLNTESQRRASWIEHRLRLDGTVDYQDTVRITASVDALNGVIWGDNGTLGQEPAPNSGANVTTRNPNLATPCVSYTGERDPLQAESYGYGLCAGTPIEVRRLYGDVVTPIGLLRIGRQPITVGTSVQASDGDGRTNRFGFSREGNSVDRVLFATKPLEALNAPGQRDKSDQRGLIMVLAYDRLVTDAVRLFGDDVHQTIVNFRFLSPDNRFAKDTLLSTFWVHRFDWQYATRVHAIGARAQARFGKLFAGVDAAVNLGSTREVAEAYQIVNNDPIVDQTVRQLGVRAAARWDERLWSAYLELDYASGDGDPQVRTPLTQFVFAEDANVGLLLFEHVLGFQSARAAAAGTEILRRLGGVSYPVEAVNTRGAFTNAFAIFPQVDFRPHPTVLLRGGVLMAWAPEPVVDPLASLQARDGATIDDDLVNFAGGKPGNYYGTELCGRAQWRFLDHFAADLEGALLLPGDALEDENHDAVNSFLVQTRTTFFF